MPLLLQVPTERVQLTTPGEWVEVKTRLSKGDESKIRAAAFRVQASMQAGSRDTNVDVGLDYEASVFAGLELGVVAWSFAEPVTPANLRALSPEDYDVVTERVNELWAPRTDDDRKNSSGSGVLPSSTAAPFPASSAG